jgi:DNA repair protein RecN (Recombination protein N)
VSGPGGDTNARLELLNYQVDELSQFAPQAGELQTLDQELKRLANITTMTETCSQLLEQLAGPDSPAVLSVLQTGSRELDNLPDDDPKLFAAAELLATAGISLQEAVNDLRSYTDALEPDPTRITEIEQRLSSAHDLARKHRISADELDATLSNLRGEIEALAVNEGLVESLNQRMTDVRSNYLNVAKKLSDSRTRAANKLGLAVSKQLKVLGMSGSVFTITVEEETDAVRSHGTDQVEFMVSTNPGQPALPLARVVSGGELSRISLALQVVTTGGTGIPTIIFDEVDVGIGGNIAEVVGQHMHGLARHRQVLCVTHLPQVASQADAHVQVQKKTTKTRVQTRFEKLADDGRVEEIARMLGGLEITAQTRAHAREMLARD